MIVLASDSHFLLQCCAMLPRSQARDSQNDEEESLSIRGRHEPERPRLHPRLFFSFPRTTPLSPSWLIFASVRIRTHMPNVSHLRTAFLLRESIPNTAANVLLPLSLRAQPAPSFTLALEESRQSANRTRYPYHSRRGSRVPELPPLVPVEASLVASLRRHSPSSALGSHCRGLSMVSAAASLLRYVSATRNGPT